jgi:hypothetical protein
MPVGPDALPRSRFDGARLRADDGRWLLREAGLFNLTDIFLQSRGAEALNLFAKQFDLPKDQANAALRAMMPAFALAMQRQLADPKSWPALFSMMGGRQPANPFDPLGFFATEATKSRSSALEQLFGSADVIKAIANHTALMTGISQGTIQSMMPVVGGTLMAGLGAAFDQSPFGPIFRAFANLPRETPDTALAEMMQRFLETLPRPTGETETFDQLMHRLPNPAGPGSTFDETFGAFIRGYNRGRPKKRPPQPLELGTMVGQMIQAGQDVQASQVQAFNEIFDSFWGKGMRV